MALPFAGGAKHAISWRLGSKPGNDELDDPHPRRPHRARECDDASVAFAAVRRS